MPKRAMSDSHTLSDRVSFHTTAGWRGRPEDRDLGERKREEDGREMEERKRRCRE